MAAEWIVAVSIELSPDVDEAAYDRWYDERHLPAIAECPGFQPGARYTEDRPPGGGEPRRDLTLYEISGPDALESPEFRQRRGFEEFAESVGFSTRVYQRRGAR